MDGVPQISTPICSSCHIVVRPTDYFCYNCGKNLRPKPLSISWENQVLIYIGSVLLPPMGFIWGFRYLREKEEKSKMIGIVAIILTIVVLVVVLKLSIDLINTINTQVNTQVQNLMQF